MQTILLVDSCALTRECLSTILRAKGFRVQCAGLIGQAKAMIAKRAPDLLITEIRLPDDNALNLMRTLKASPRGSKIKVCLLTQAAAKKPIMEAIELGASKVMLKSKFTVGGFIEQIAAIVAEPAGASSGGGGGGGGAPSPGQSTPTRAELRYPLPEPCKDPSVPLKAIKPIIARSQLKDRLQELDELRTLNEPITEILRAIDTPEASIESLSELLKMDQAVAMKIMRIANSSAYARAEPITTLKDAVLRIGLEHIRELVMGIGIINNYADQELPVDGFDHRLFWEHALAVALCSAKIARLCADDVNPELCFTGGILHDIGRVIMLETLPEEYPRVLDTAHTLGISLELVEKRMLLADHTTIAQSMLTQWNLPKDLIDGIANHHCPPNKIPSVCPQNTTLVAIIALADRVVHAMGIGSSGNGILSPSEELFEILDTPALSVDGLCEGLNEQLAEMRSLFFPSDDDAELPTHPNGSGCPVFDRTFHPLYLTIDPRTDAIGHWILSNADAPQDLQKPGVPTIAIIHARQPRDRQTLGKLLVDAQASLPAGSNAGALPVLMLSPNGKTALPDEIMTRHPSLHLMTPFTQLHFERAVNHLLNGSVRPLEDWTKPKAA